MLDRYESRDHTKKEVCTLVAKIQHHPSRSKTWHQNARSLDQIWYRLQNQGSSGTIVWLLKLSAFRKGWTTNVLEINPSTGAACMTELVTGCRLWMKSGTSATPSYDIIRSG